MSLALAVGGAVAFDGMVPRRCDDCGYTTHVSPDEAEALWVVCRWCYNRAVGGGR